MKYSPPRSPDLTSRWLGRAYTSTTCYNILKVRVSHTRHLIHLHVHFIVAMGCNSSKPQGSSLPAAKPVTIHSIHGHRNVSRPPVPPQKNTLQDLIDPDEIAPHQHVRSPSGNLLGREQFLNHPQRPRCMRERQESIRNRVQIEMAQHRAEQRAEMLKSQVR